MIGFYARLSIATATAAVALAAILVSGCQKEELLPGVGYRVPGESTSSKLLPLTVPPDFGLRPQPADETPEGFEIVSSQVEEVVLFQNDTITLGEEVILTRADAIDADPQIRRLLDQDNAVFVGNPAFVDELLYGDFPEGGDVSVVEVGDVTEDVIIREGVGDDESDFDFLYNWF